MSGRTYLLSVIALFGVSSAFWWAVFSWLGVESPAPLVAVFDAIVFTSYLFMLRWFLSDSSEAQVDMADSMPLQKTETK